MFRITHTPADLGAAATRHRHHRHVLDLANELKRIGAWLTHPKFSGLPSLVHDLEIIVAVAALALMLVVAAVVHLWWLPRHGINGFTGEPRAKYYELRGWTRRKQS